MLFYRVVDWTPYLNSCAWRFSWVSFRRFRFREAFYGIVATQNHVIVIFLVRWYFSVHFYVQHVPETNPNGYSYGYINGNIPYIQCGAPVKSMAKLVNITPTTMEYYMYITSPQLLERLRWFA
jgi:hypothetical protein